MQNFNYLDELESESVYILREVAGQFEKPTLLFSGGKDSTVLIKLIEKSFRPGKIPFKILHIDTGHNFPETLEFRDNLMQKIGEEIIVRYVQNSIDKGRAKEQIGKGSSRNTLQTITLLDTIEEFKIDACIGGARRDEEKARAKERIFSFRNSFGEWDPKAQRPELWNIYNGRINKGENVRVFPISNWTELDIWNYIKRENVELPSIYFSHQRDCVLRDNQLLSKSDYIFMDEKDIVINKTVRFRTVGDMSCTSAVESTASNIDEIIEEIKISKISERGARMDDKTSDTAMEDRKIQGYF